MCQFLIVGCQVDSKYTKVEPKDDFVSLSKEIPTLIIVASYSGNNNFIGSPIPGYLSTNLLLSKEAAKALQCAEQSLRKDGYGLRIFDAYRPQKAVNHFVDWAKQLNDTLNKREYYPNVEKSALFIEGYIAEKSGHSRGSAVDLTLFSLSDSIEVDMGTPFDFFGLASHPTSNLVSDKHTANRMILRKAMESCGFNALETEWWHFYLNDEPFPKTYFDFDIE